MKQWVIKTLKNKDEQTIQDVLLYFYFHTFFLNDKTRLFIIHGYVECINAKNRIV